MDPTEPNPLEAPSNNMEPNPLQSQHEEFYESPASFASPASSPQTTMYDTNFFHDDHEGDASDADVWSSERAFRRAYGLSQVDLAFLQKAIDAVGEGVMRKIDAAAKLSMGSFNADRDIWQYLPASYCEAAMEVEHSSDVDSEDSETTHRHVKTSADNLASIVRVSISQFVLLHYDGETVFAYGSSCPGLAVYQAEYKAVEAFLDQIKKQKHNKKRKKTAFTRSEVRWQLFETGSSSDSAFEAVNHLIKLIYGLKGTFCSTNVKKLCDSDEEISTKANVEFCIPRPEDRHAELKRVAADLRQTRHEDASSSRRPHVDGLIIDVVDSVGTTGYISVVEGNDPWTTWQRFEGWSSECGLPSKWDFTTDSHSCTLEFPTVYVTDADNVTSKLCTALLNLAKFRRSSLLVVAPSVEEEGLELLATSHKENNVKCGILVPASTGAELAEDLADCAASCGCAVANLNGVTNFRKITLADFVGSAKGFHQNSVCSVVMGKAHDLHTEHLNKLRQEYIKQQKNDMLGSDALILAENRDRLHMRVAKLTKCFATIRVQRGHDTAEKTAVEKTEQAVSSFRDFESETAQILLDARICAMENSRAVLLPVLRDTLLFENTYDRVSRGELTEAEGHGRRSEGFNQVVSLHETLCKGQDRLLEADGILKEIDHLVFCGALTEDQATARRAVVYDAKQRILRGDTEVVEKQVRRDLLRFAENPDKAENTNAAVKLLGGRVEMVYVHKILQSDEVLLMNIGFEVSMLHIRALAQQPRLASMLWGATKKFAGLPTMLGHLVVSMSDFFSRNAMTFAELEGIVPLPRSFFTERIEAHGSRIRCLEAFLTTLRPLEGKAPVGGRSLGHVASFSTVRKQDPEAFASYCHRLSRILQLCTDGVTASLTPRFDTPKFLLPFDGPELQWVDDSGKTHRERPEPDSVYGLAARLFYEGYGGSSGGGKQDEPTAISTSMKTVVSKHKKLLETMESSAEVSEAYAKLPHPKLVLTSIFTVLAVMLALLNIAVLSPPHLQANTNVIEKRIGVCLSDYYNNSDGLRVALEEVWWNNTVYQRQGVAGNGTQIRGRAPLDDCLGALTAVVLLYHESQWSEQDIQVKFVDLHSRTTPVGMLTPVQSADVSHRLSFPRALYFSHRIVGQGLFDIRQKHLVATEVLVDYMAGPRVAGSDGKTKLFQELKLRFSHRYVPITVDDPFVGVEANQAFWVMGYFATTLAAFGVVLVTYYDIAFLRWSQGTPFMPTYMDLARRGMVFMCRIIAIVTSFVALVTAEIAPDNASLAWDSTEVQTWTRASLVIRLAMMFCVPPIVHGASFCGHQLFSVGVLGAAWVILPILLVAFVTQKTEVGTQSLLLNMRLNVSTSTLLAAVVSAMAISYINRNKMSLEKKQFWIFFRKNYNLKVSRTTAAFMITAYLIQVGALVTAVLIAFWAQIFLSSSARTERFNLAASDGMMSVGLVDSIIALAVPLGIVAANVMGF